MDSVNRFFLMAAGLIITAGLVFLAFRMADIGAETAGHVMEEVMMFGNEIQENEILQYDEETVSGSDVRNFLHKYLSNNYGREEWKITVTVITGRDRMLYQRYEDIKEINNFSHVSYIDPTALFLGTVKRNENGVISEVCFEQR